MDDHKMDVEEQPPAIDHPWPYLRELFDVVSFRNDSYQMCCLLCKPKVHHVQAYRNSASNLKKHMQRKHVLHLDKYTEFASAKGEKRKTPEGPSSTTKQLKLWETKRVSQKSMDDAIMNFVIGGLHPLSVVEQPGFTTLVNLLQPDMTVMCRGTVKNKVEKATVEMKKNLKAAMGKVEYIATTTDCWTAHRRGFIGVTAHWIEPNSLERCSAALACKQLKGSHTFTVLAGALTDIHTEYDIHDKIVRTTTDSGSNFVKAFKVYAVTQEDENNQDPRLGAEPGQTGEEGESSGEEEENMEVECVEAAALLDLDDSLEYKLPKHHRCACHLLNLVATVDIRAANDNTVYKKISRSTFSKCQALWNKSSRSTIAAEIIAEKCKLELVRPNDTRWNSLFLAVERIGRIIKERGEGAIAAVCSALKIPMLTPAEVAFLKEYAKTMAPVAKALDYLQGEKYVYMGWLVPTITQLKTKLEEIQISSHYCAPLLDALQAGLDSRFGEMLADPELIAAAILIPKFKTAWTRDEGILKRGLDYIKSHLKEPPTVRPGDTSQSSEEEDFFSTIKQSSAQKNSNAMQLEFYMASPAGTMHALQAFPAVCNLSIKLNTPLPASAACERLFSTAGLIFRPKRARLGSKNFENLLLLKLNQKFI